MFVRAVLLQDIFELRQALLPWVEPVLNSINADGSKVCFNQVIRWIVCERLERDHCEIVRGHSHQDTHFRYAYHLLQSQLLNHGICLDQWIHSALSSPRSLPGEELIIEIQATTLITQYIRPYGPRTRNFYLSTMS